MFRQAVSFSGGASTGTNRTQLIASTVKFTGISGFALNCNNYGQAVQPAGGEANLIKLPSPGWWS